jgi:RNA polymerase sigma factor (sigma-70 family)
VKGLTDSQLLRDYAERRSEAAFGELVRRHIDLVYSAALRMVRDAHLAEDVTQSVFVALAGSAPQLTERPVLSGWLHRTAQNLAAKAIRSEVRRRTREQKAATMNELLANPEDTWEQIAPHLDAALAELSEPERDAVVCRYFERKSARDMAQTLGISDQAAQKRVNRGVERLREFFTKRGVNIGTGGLVVAISANAVHAAPVGLAVTISATALASTVAAGAAVIAATTKTLTMTTLQKTLVTATIAVLAGVGTYEARQAVQLRDQVQKLQQQQASLLEQIQQLTQGREEATQELAAARAELTHLRNAAGSRATAPENATDLTVKLWLARMNKLKDHMRDNSHAWIPECKFLTDEDWLRASNQPLDSDESLRRAASSLRQAGKNKFVAMALAAVRSFAQTNAEGFPAALDQLKSTLDPRVDDSILDRYEVLPLKELPVASLAGKWAIAEKAPVDAAYDSRGIIGAQGFLFTEFRSFPIDPKIWQPYAAYRAANPGRNPTEPTQLLPYATTDEQQQAIQSAIEAFGAVRQP